MDGFQLFKLFDYLNTSWYQGGQGALYKVYMSVCNDIQTIYSNFAWTVNTYVHDVLHNM